MRHISDFGHLSLSMSWTLLIWILWTFAQPDSLFAYNFCWSGLLRPCHIWLKLYCYMLYWSWLRLLSCDRHLDANDVDCMHSRHLEPSGSTADAQCEQCRSDLLSAVHFWPPPDAEGGLLWCTQFDGWDADDTWLKFSLFAHQTLHVMDLFALAVKRVQLFSSTRVGGRTSVKGNLLQYGRVGISWWSTQLRTHRSRSIWPIQVTIDLTNKSDY